jgi:hypothetical protein
VAAQEARQVADHSAPERQDPVVAPGAAARELAQDPLGLGQRLGCLAAAHLDQAGDLGQ